MAPSGLQGLLSVTALFFFLQQILQCPRVCEKMVSKVNNHVNTRGFIPITCPSSNRKEKEPCGLQEDVEKVLGDAAS